MDKEVVVSGYSYKPMIVDHSCLFCFRFYPLTDNSWYGCHKDFSNILKHFYSMVQW